MILNLDAAAKTGKSSGPEIERRVRCREHYPARVACEQSAGPSPDFQANVPRFRENIKVFRHRDKQDPEAEQRMNGVCARRSGWQLAIPAPPHLHYHNPWTRFRGFFYLKFF